MLRIIYSVPLKDKDSENAWLKEQHIYPSMKTEIKFNSDYTSYIEYMRFGMIVFPEVAVWILLRHPDAEQVEYRK